MRVLVACEFSGIVRDAFRARGHYAVSVDLLPSERPGPHLRCDVRKLIRPGRWDLMLAFPPCKYLARSGLHWFGKIPGREQQMLAALNFVRELMDAPIDKICIENPYGIISTRIRPPDQIIQPHWFGHAESKATCLWLKNLPQLKATNRLYLQPGEYWNNVIPGHAKQHKRPHSKAREKDASRTYVNVAEAMAEQWGTDL